MTKSQIARFEKKIAHLSQHLSQDEVLTTAVSVISKLLIELQKEFLKEMKARKRSKKGV